MLVKGATDLQMSDSDLNKMLRYHNSDPGNAHWDDTLQPMENTQMPHLIDTRFDIF